MKVTLGPKGRYVVIDKKFGAPTITNDGVSIAREIEIEDPFENQGAQLVEVATATNDVAGDGTTTATVLAQAIVHEGLKNVAAGANPLALKRGIEKAVDQVVEAIGKQSNEISARISPGHGHPGQDAARRGAHAGGGDNAHGGQQHDGQADDHGETLPAGHPGRALPGRHPNPWYLHLPRSSPERRLAPRGEWCPGGGTS